MTEKSLSDHIRHYQKDIEKCPENSERMMRCLKRLFILPVKVIHLQETGIGRSVNGLRKYPGEVGDTATALVAKWKSMVAAEDSECEQEVEEEEIISEEPIIETRVCNGTEKTPEIHSRDKENIRVNHSDKSKHHSKHSSRDKERKDEKHSSSRHKSSDKHKDRDRDDKKEKSRSHSRYEDKNVSKSSSSDSHKKSSTHKSDKSKNQEDKHSRHKDRKEERRKESSKDKEKVKLKVEPNSDEDRRPDKRKSTSKSEVQTKRSKFIKEESSSECEDERPADSDRYSSSEPELSHSGSDDDAPPVRIKQEPVSSDSDSDHGKPTNAMQSSHTSKHSYKEHKKKDPPKDLKSLIADNEKKIKKEKLDKSPEKKHRSSTDKPKSTEKIRMERNHDGSIDNCSGASFGDALLGLSSSKAGKKKKKSSGGSVRSTSESRPSSSAHSSPTHSSSSSPHKTLDLLREPDVLSKRIKLEPLPLDISSTLPEISTNYRPLPQPQIPSRRHSRSNNEEEAMYNIMTTKNQRTKVFSGNKSIHHTSVPSLYNCCIQVLYENIDGLEYTGGVPFDILKPLLTKLTADQLLQLEHYNPYLVEDTDQLWNFHCKKDFRSSSKEQEDSWRDLYLKCTDERERKLKRLTANITESMAKSVPVRQAKLAYVDSVVKPPRNVARKQAKYGTGGSSSGSKPSTSGAGTSPSPSSSSSSQASKRDIVSKAVVGGFTPATPATDVVSFNNPVAASKILKKKKAPLMAKALQLIKSNNRYKR